MSNVDLFEVVTDDDIADPFMVVRSTGRWVRGAFQGKQESFKAWGVVSNVSPEELNQVPEGDRVTGMRGFACSRQLYRTFVDNSGAGMSDILVFDNVKYRVVAVLPYKRRGYWKAIAAKMSGE